MACAHQHIPTGHRIWIWYLRALQAEALALTGELQRAQELIDESLEQLGQGEERAHYAEVLRLKGWVLIQQGDFDAAQKSLRTAIEVCSRPASKILGVACRDYTRALTCGPG